jgi:hypothetical protein
MRIWQLTKNYACRHDEARQDSDKDGVELKKKHEYRKFDNHKSF